ncbi:MAG: phosphopyruvate hydratase [Chloroflexota bacterium]|nr:phosphopyruvate hydratase [Chloroflexota bacterium]
MADLRIRQARGREILDSRGRPTVEADVILGDGTVGRASVPSGASTGRHEAVELRDGDRGRYGGFGVRRAVAHVNEELAPAVAGLDAGDQRAVDARLIERDGTPDKGRLGANAILAVSLAACRAAAAARGRPLYRHIAGLAGVERPTIPLPMVNIISGGLHAGGQLDIQDVLVIPTGARSFAEALERVSAIHAAVGARVRAEGHQPLVADEGGWAPRLPRNEDALAWTQEALGAAGLTAGADVALAVDVAASHFHEPGSATYRLRADDRLLGADQLTQLLAGWAERYAVVSLEDGLAEDDWDGWRRLTAALGACLQLLGDDIFTTNPARLERGIREGIANAVLVKPNQIGTLTETLDVIRRARAAGYRTVVSARSGETEDSFLADLAAGSAAGQIKVGSVTRSSRLAKWNQLLRIEEELGPDAYVGAAALAPPAAGATL